jgi:hypothetical protein
MNALVTGALASLGGHLVQGLRRARRPPAPPIPALPQHRIDETTALYVEMFEHLTGEAL